MRSFAADHASPINDDDLGAGKSTVFEHIWYTARTGPLNRSPSDRGGLVL
jgi:hypothetical protein